MADSKEDVHMEEFDENKASASMDRYSRAIAALGVDTMRNLGKLEVLIIGQKGVGIETAKNLILAGPKGVTLYDNEVVEIADLGTNFYLKHEHVGKSKRAAAVAKALAELNPSVDTSVYEGELSEQFIHKFGAVIITVTLPRKELIRINHVCRTRKLQGVEAPVSFLWAATHGVTGSLFVDFGDSHLCTDRNGEPTKDLVVESITVKGVVEVAAKSHDMDDGDRIMFSEIEGSMSVLNNKAGVKVKRIYEDVFDAVAMKKTGRKVLVPNKFQIDLSETDLKPEQLGEWKTGGIITEVKPQTLFNFKSLEESLVNPAADEQSQMYGGVRHMDAGRWMGGFGSQLHFALLGSLEFEAKHGHLPRLHDKKDASAVVQLAEAALAHHKELEAAGKSALVVEKLDTTLIRQFALYARAELSGYAAFLGGVAAQEVLKKFGKFTPINQWLTLDHLEMLGPDVPSDSAPKMCRYDHQISIFGQAFQHKISNQRWFMVGCGALGCEYMKAIALMGIATGQKGRIFVTDMDRIELSNLSRQFLFRSKHIGKSKALCGSQVAKEMNPELNIETFEQKVWSGTEDLFDDAFWDSLDGVWNALDNVQARRYTDSKCLLHKLPLFESGTQGTKANSEIILPFKTKSYSDHKDVDTGGIPQCTLRNFPHLIIHCIEWAKPMFSELFELGPKDFNSFVQDREKFFANLERLSNDAERIELLEKVKSLLEVSKDRTFENAMRLAFGNFTIQYRDRIKNLIHHFPENARKTRTLDNGEKVDMGAFWSGSHRFPQVAEFDIKNEDHLQYLYNATNLYAVMLGIEPVRELTHFLDLVRKAHLQAPEWKPPTKGPSDMDEEGKEKNEEAEEDEEDAAKLEQLQSYLSAIDLATLKPLKDNEFEKDDDSNFHIDFVTSCANMRAWNYKIQPATRHKVKMVAGRIIPALATTTAMICGLVTLEFYKYSLGFQFLEQDRFKNALVNLATAEFNFFAPEPANRAREEKTVLGEGDDAQTQYTRPYPAGFTTWDEVVVDRGDLTVNEFVKIFPEIHHGVRVDLLSKYELTQEDIKEGKGKPLFQNEEERRAPMAEQQLKRDNLSERHRAIFEKQIADCEAYNAQRRAHLNRNLKDLYVEFYGELPSESRNYLLLGGGFQVPPADEEDDKDLSASIPVIKYIFKH